MEGPLQLRFVSEVVKLSYFLCQRINSKEVKEDAEEEVVDVEKDEASTDHRGNKATKTKMKRNLLIRDLMTKNPPQRK